jgi:Flp pilus assembly protein TadD
MADRRSVMRPALLALLTAFAVAVAAEVAAMPKLSAPPTVSAEYLKGEALARDGKFREAIGVLLTVVRTEPANADAHTFLGFSYRKLGEIEPAERHYRAALDIEPDNLGALEYYGELFLQKREPARAQELLDKLVKLCPLGCEERTTLEAAVQRAKAGG